MLEFAYKEYRLFFLTIPLLIVLFWLGMRMRKKAIARYGDLSLIPQLMPDLSYTRPVLKFIFVMLALGFLIITIMGPQFGIKLQEVKRQGVEIIIALDVSNSMLAEDIVPSRLESAKQSISKLVNKLEGDKIGLIVFAGQAYTQVPITTDYGAVKMFLQTVNTNIVPTQGTAIGEAINLAARSFTPDMDTDKAIIVITDGENHEDDPIQAATAAAEKGIFVHTIGMGLVQGAPIPTGRAQEFRKDKNGQVIISRLDEAMLSQIAIVGGGIYIRAGNSRSSLDMLFDKIDEMEGQEYESKVYSEYEHQFQYFAGAALFFLLLELIILERRNRLLKDVKIFKTKF